MISLELSKHLYFFQNIQNIIVFGVGTFPLSIEDIKYLIKYTSLNEKQGTLQISIENKDKQVDKAFDNIQLSFDEVKEISEILMTTPSNKSDPQFLQQLQQLKQKKIQKLNQQQQEQNLKNTFFHSNNNSNSLIQQQENNNNNNNVNYISNSLTNDKTSTPSFKQLIKGQKQFNNEYFSQSQQQDRENSQQQPQKQLTYIKRLQKIKQQQQSQQIEDEEQEAHNLKKNEKQNGKIQQIQFNNCLEQSEGILAQEKISQQSTLEQSSSLSDLNISLKPIVAISGKQKHLLKALEEKFDFNSVNPLVFQQNYQNKIKNIASQCSLKDLRQSTLLQNNNTSVNGTQILDQDQSISIEKGVIHDSNDSELDCQTSQQCKQSSPEKPYLLVFSEFNETNFDLGKYNRCYKKDVDDQDLDLSTVLQPIGHFKSNQGLSKIISQNLAGFLKNFVTQENQ